MRLMPGAIAPVEGMIGRGLDKAAAVKIGGRFKGFTEPDPDAPHRAARTRSADEGWSWRLHRSCARLVGRGEGIITPQSPRVNDQGALPCPAFWPRCSTETDKETPWTCS